MDDSKATSESTPPFVIFDALQAVSLFILFATIIPPLVSRDVKRMKTWFMLMISTVVCCISFLLLIGRQSGPSPPFGLCVYQAGLIYAAPPTVAASALMFVIELHWRICSALTNVEVNRARMNVLLFFPPIIHLVVFFLPLSIGLSHRTLVRRVPAGGIYCQIIDRTPTIVTGVLVVVFILAMFLVECYTISYIWQRRKACRDIRMNGRDGHYPFQSFIRIAVYTLIGGFTIVITDFVNTLPDDNVIGSGMLAIAPLSIALLFGSQVDIIRFYFRCRKTNWTPLSQSESK